MSRLPALTPDAPLQRHPVPILDLVARLPPDLCAALSEIEDLDPSIDLVNAVYFGARDQIVRKSTKSRMSRWRIALFAFLYRNAVKAVDRFNLPSDNVVEIGRQIEV